jgi:hypothetical protein
MKYSGDYLKPIGVIVNANGKLQVGIRWIGDLLRKTNLVNIRIRFFASGVVKTQLFISSIIR